MNSINVKPIASFQFKQGAVTLGDLGKMISKGEDGDMTLSVPKDVLVSSQDQTSASDSAGISDPFGWNSEVKESSQATSKPEVRPEAQEAIDFLSNADDIRVIHTTRSMPPQYPDGFAAGRFAVGAKSGDQTRTFIMNTEGRVSHLGQVIPGKTQVDGYVAQVSDPYGQVSESSKFNESELEAMTIAMMKNKPDEPATDFVAAIYSNGDQAKYSKAYIEAIEI